MKKITVSDNKSLWYPIFLDIYTSSFPLHEQRTEEQQNQAFAHSQYHLDIYTEGEDLLSFISYWEFENYIYIEHLAVNQSFRGNNIGSRLLQDFTAGHSKVVILEIDPLVDEISRKRLEFYKRNGFIDNPYLHFHPAYRSGFPAHELIVLSHGGAISEELYETFRKELTDIVMKHI